MSTYEKVIRAALRHEMGRWRGAAHLGYVFRDVPWAVVARIATWPIPDGDADVESFVQAARDELKLRATSTLQLAIRLFEQETGEPKP